MEMPYVLIKKGAYYAHNSAGYVVNVLNAELYSENYAKGYAKMSSGDVKAVPITDILKDADEIQEYIDRLSEMRDAVRYKNAKSGT